jgi:hypothetical protein
MHAWLDYVSLTFLFWFHPLCIKVQGMVQFEPGPHRSSPKVNPELDPTLKSGFFQTCNASLSVVRLGRWNVDATVDDSAVILRH